MTACSPAGFRVTLWTAWGILLLAVLCGGCRRGEESSAGDNLLLITLDTTRADHLGCYAALRSGGPVNSRRATTPHLDALAARGVLFANATAQAPLTLPSHASIMTGKYPPLHKLRDMEGFVLDPSQATLAKAARSGRIETAAFVGSRVLARQFGLSEGFLTYDDEMPRASEKDEHAGAYSERRASVVTDRALEWLRNNGRRRFVLWTHYFDPHAPYDPPEPYKSAYAGDPYSGELAYTDEQVGRLLDGLRQIGLESRTLVAVIGDHGESLGEHGEMTHGVFLYDSTLHVPFLLAGPGIPPGKVIEQQIRSIDLLPTFLAYLKLPAIEGAQGVSLWPLIGQGTRVNSGYSYSETLYPRTYMGWSELSSMRTNDWKLVIAPRPELYDLKNDPAETQNVISKFPAEAERLRNQMAALDSGGRETVVTPTATDSSARRQLESLGYLGAGVSRQIHLGTPAPDPKDRVEVLQMLTRVEDLLNRGMYSQAATLMEKGLQLDPTNPRCHLSLGMAYEKMGQYPRAIAVFRHALDRNIQTDRIYSRLGIDYLHLAQTQKAVDALEQATAINAKDLNSLLNLGMAYMQLGRASDAEKAFRAIASRDDGYAAAHNGLGLVAIQRGDITTARREFERAVALDPEEPKFLLDLGILHQNTGDAARAASYLHQFLSKSPPNSPQLHAVREALRELETAPTAAARR